MKLFADFMLALLILYGVIGIIVPTEIQARITELCGIALFPGPIASAIIIRFGIVLMEVVLPTLCDDPDW